MEETQFHNSDPKIKSWIKTGIIAGVVACISYPLAVFIPMPDFRLNLFIASCFGPALAIASLALGKILLDRHWSVSSQLGAVSNILAGTLVTTMLIVQLAIRYSTVSSFEPEIEKFVIDRTWDVVLGLDVSFDIFIGLATIFFGISMIHDPRFGRIMGILGIVIGSVVIIGFNIYTFPTPPANAGLVDSGPITGLWYTIATVQIIYYALKQKRNPGNK